LSLVAPTRKTRPQRDGWSRAGNDRSTIRSPLPSGRQFVTLKDAGTYIATDDGGAAQSLSVPIAAALVSTKGHMKIRRLPNFVDIRAFLVCFQTGKEWPMRIFTASVIIAALSLGTPAFVQAQGASSQPQAQTPPDQSSTVIRSIQVVDIKDLKPALRSKVDEVVAHTSEEDMQSLRKSIDATPEAASALKAKGLSSSQVVAINLADGVLTLFAKTAWSQDY
jgi:hypothetical protein